jgi:hypothetical protein
MPRLKHVAALATAALTTLTLTAVTMTGAVAQAKTATPAVVITPAQAATVLATYATTVNQANATYDTALRDTVEGGSQRQLDDADYRLSILLGYGTYLRIKDVAPRIYLPRQTRYPAVFVVFTRTKYGNEATSTGSNALLFQKASSVAPWRVTASPGFDKADLPAFAVDKNGYLPTLDAATLSVTPAVLYPALLKAENLAATGHQPSAAWAYNSTWKQDLSLSRADAVDQHLTFSSTHLAPVCLATKIGALCFTSSAEVETDTLTDAELANGVRYTVDTRDTQYNAGGVPQGRYTMLRTVRQRQIAVVVPRKPTKAKLNVIGETWGTISGRGTIG